MASKNVLLGISGGIAAYKTYTLIRLFVKNGYNVKVITTKNALNFVNELTLRTLSNNRVCSDMFSFVGDVSTEHIALSEWADVFVVAPATANIIGKYANAIADDMLSTCLLACNKQIFFAPAMNTNMYNNKGVQENLQTLKKRGIQIIEPNNGELACGTVGQGRMAEAEEIFDRLEVFFSTKQDLEGKTFLITAGPTVEQIDSVRFISNNSSGRMGYALAQEIIDRGGVVNLVSGPVSIDILPNRNLHLIKVTSAKEMYEMALKYFENSDVAICSAAVADYTPKTPYNGKMKKKQESVTIELEPTKDILKTLAKNKGNRILVGFALETDNEIENAKKKLLTKNLDFIVLNSLNDKGAGFEYTTNKVTLIDKQDIVALPLKSKTQVAKDIIDKTLTFL
ncbi:MAG: bifunctional phosphopantothenoylcysteine decarboxylase/phosphopantothenate--cysteine ligase CoaBC [Bacteroidota bacterium]|nr:bifunctional phosphopantothenoylcysteine decarboxylase/phosphopantothenate--cysteine ligase CoaBC [Bacteroidota bacterium]